MARSCPTVLRDSESSPMKLANSVADPSSAAGERASRGMSRCSRPPRAGHMDRWPNIPAAAGHPVRVPRTGPPVYPPAVSADRPPRQGRLFAAARNLNRNPLLVERARRLRASALGGDEHVDRLSTARGRPADVAARQLVE